MQTWLLTFTGSTSSLYLKDEHLLDQELAQHICSAFPNCSENIKQFFIYLESIYDMLKNCRNLTYEIDDNMYANLFSVSKEPEILPILVFTGNTKSVIKNLSDSFYIYCMLNNPKFSIVEFYEFVWEFGNPSKDNYRFVTLDGITMKAPYYQCGGS